MAFSSAITFITDPNDANKGKIKFVCTQSTAAVVNRVYIQITSPDGVVFKTEPASPGDMQITGVGSGTIYVSIPTVDNGEYMNGTYNILIEISVVTGPSESAKTTSLNQDYTFCAHNKPGSNLSSKVVYGYTLSCVTALLVVTDSTDYEGLGLDIGFFRENRINFPPIDGRDPEIETGAVASTDIQWVNVNYEALLKVSYFYDQTGSEVLTAVIKTQGGSINPLTIPAKCQSSICAQLSCAQEIFDSLYAAACGKYGSWANIPTTDKENFYLMMSALSLANMQFACGNVSKAEALLVIVGQTSNCDCGCSDSSELEPTPWVAPT